MFKKTVTFQDFNGEKQTKDFYFHMSKAELLQLAADGNVMMERIKRMTETKDASSMLKEVRELIWMSVGVRSEDGQRFVKDTAAKGQLFESPAYDELLMELATQADSCVDFIKNLIPEQMQKEMQEQLKKQKSAEAVDPFKEPAEDDSRPAWLKENRNPTPAELQNMSKEEMVLAFQHRSFQPPVA
jgi:hypothetical protein